MRSRSRVLQSLEGAYREPSRRRRERDDKPAMARLDLEYQRGPVTDWRCSSTSGTCWSPRRRRRRAARFWRRPRRYVRSPSYGDEGPMKIYTRTGDGGETALFGGGRVPKDHPRVAAYGTVRVERHGGLGGSHPSRRRGRRAPGPSSGPLRPGRRARHPATRGRQAGSEGRARSPRSAASPRWSIGSTRRRQSFRSCGRSSCPGGIAGAAALHVARARYAGGRSGRWSARRHGARGRRRRGLSQSAVRYALHLRPIGEPPGGREPTWSGTTGDRRALRSVSARRGAERRGPAPATPGGSRVDAPPRTIGVPAAGTRGRTGSLAAGLVLPPLLRGGVVGCGAAQHRPRAGHATPGLEARQPASPLVPPSRAHER